MATYSVDGVDYDIDDGLDLGQTVAAIRASEGHKQAVNPKDDEHTFGRALMENTKGAITAVGDLIGSTPGMIMGIPGATVKGIQEGPKAGLEEYGNLIEGMNPLSPNFGWGQLPGTQALEQDRQTGAYENLNKPFQMMGEGWRDIGKVTTEALGGDPQLQEEMGAVGELGLGFLGGASMVRGGQAVKEHITKSADASRKAEFMRQAIEEEAKSIPLQEAIARAKELQYQLDLASQTLDAKVTGKSRDLDARLSREQDRIYLGKTATELQEIITALNTRKTALMGRITTDQAEHKAYEEAYKQYDSNLGTKAAAGKKQDVATPYGKDRVGPQYGGSKRMDRHADEAGKREGPSMDRELGGQKAFDDDMARLGREFEIERLKQEDVAKYVDTWKPEERRLDSLPKSEADLIAEETRAAMGPRDRGVDTASSLEQVLRDQTPRMENPEAQGIRNGWRWTNKEVSWQSYTIDPTAPIERQRTMDVIKHGDEYRVEGPRDYGSTRTNNDVAYFPTRKQAQLYAEDYGNWITDKNPSKRPDQFDPKYNPESIDRGQSETKMGWLVDDYPVQVAIKVQDQIFNGINHADASERAAKQLNIDSSEIFKHAEHGYQTIDGNFVTRAQADAMWGPIAKTVEAPTTKQFGYNERLRVMQEDPASFSARQMLSEIRESSSIPYYKELANLLLADKTFNPRFGLRDAVPENKSPEGWRGWYQFKDYRIELMRAGAGEEALFLHEAVHARTHSAIEYVLRAPGVTPHLAPAVNRLQDLYKSFDKLDYSRREKHALQNNNIFPETPYGTRTIHEFIAEAFTNPEFQALLARTEVPRNLRSHGFKLYWDLFVDRIGKLLGFSSKHHNYLSETIKAGADIMHGTDGSLRRAWDQSNIGVDASGAGVDSYSFKQFRDDVKERGITMSDAQLKAMYDKQQPKVDKPTSGNPNEKTVSVAANIPGINKLQRLIMETRTLEEMKPEIETARDIPQISRHLIGKMINGDYMAKDHPVLSWTSSNINRIMNKAKYDADQILHGDSKKKPSPGTYNYEWSKLSVEDRVAVNEVGQALQNAQSRLSDSGIQAKAVELTGKPLSTAQMRAYKDRQGWNQKILEKINTFLESEGKERINELPHYWSPAEFDGKWLAILEGKDGSKIVRGSYLKPNEAKLKEAFPDHKLKLVDRSSASALDFEQFVMLFRVLEKELRDPASRALAEAFRRKGFTRHGLKREGASGALGTEGGRKGLNQYEEVSEKYIRESHRYLAARELDKLYNELYDFEPAKASPNAHGLALESIDQARGGMNKAMAYLSDAVGATASKIVEIGTFGKITPPNSMLRDGIRGANEIKSALLLGFLNIQFMAANLLQSSYAVPKLLSLSADKGLFMSPVTTTKAVAKALNTYRQWNHPDILALDKIGTFEATMKYDWSTYASDMAKFKHTMRDHLSGMSTNAFIESHAVRKPAALMFLEMLRELGYDKVARNPEEIYWATKNLTDDYMVSTMRHKKPQMFGRSGLAGTIFSPLQSFTTTWAAQFREYVTQAGKSHKTLANGLPLASFLGLNLVTAGLLGFIGVKEWDVLAEWMNREFGTNVPTGTETILKHTKSTKARLGLLSDAVGVHVGSTFSAPALTGTGAPGVGFMYDAGKAIWQLFTETGALGEHNKPTEAQKRDTLKSITPRSFAWGQIEKAYTPEGAPTQTGKGVGGPYTRSEKDWTARALGMFTNEEVLGKAPQRIVEQMSANRRTKLASASGRMVDALLTEEKGEERMSKIITELQGDGFTVGEIRDSLKNQLKAKLTEKDIRMMGRGTTNRQRLIIQLYQELR